MKHASTTIFSGKRLPGAHGHCVIECQQTVKARGVVIELTLDERRAIRALQRLAKRWPQSLMLFASGTLDVRKPEPGKMYDDSYTVATIKGIPNDGGDGGIELAIEECS